MKKLSFLIILIILNSCSFDNKSGIWENSSSVSKKENSLFDGFERVSTSTKPYDEIIKLDKKFKIKFNKKADHNKWNDIFFSKSNNLSNFEITKENQIIYRSKKLTNHEVDNYILYNNGYSIISDQAGTLIKYSVKDNKVISKFNFYKKRYKKIKKKLNIVIDENNLYVSDNIGFLYALNLKNNEIVWAKNYKKPFRSNLKINKNRLITSNQNNDLLIFNKVNGEIIKLIPTEETAVKNEFVNNISTNKDTVFYINTFGSLYSIDLKSMKVSWFLNLNPSSNLNYKNLFSGTEIVNNNDKVLISSNDSFYIIDASSGSILYKKNIPLKIRPIVISNYIFLISKNNMLIAIDIYKNEILYSYDINKKIADFLKLKKQNAQIKSFAIVNDNILIFLKNSYLLEFSIFGELLNVEKLPSKIKSQPIFIENSILYLNKKNKIIVSG